MDSIIIIHPINHASFHARLNTSGPREPLSGYDGNLPAVAD
jgi:hypothetical protein